MTHPHLEDKKEICGFLIFASTGGRCANKNPCHQHGKISEETRKSCPCGWCEIKRRNNAPKKTSNLEDVSKRFDEKFPHGKGALARYGISYNQIPVGDAKSFFLSQITTAITQERMRVTKELEERIKVLGNDQNVEGAMHNLRARAYDAIGGKEFLQRAMGLFIAIEIVKNDAPTE